MKLDTVVAREEKDRIDSTRRSKRQFESVQSYREKVIQERDAKISKQAIGEALERVFNLTRPNRETPMMFLRRVLKRLCHSKLCITLDEWQAGMSR